MNDAQHKARELVNELKSFPTCTVGGPLHIITDDGNVDDTHLDFCAVEIEGHWSVDEASLDDQEKIQGLAREILGLLRPMTVIQRKEALGVGS